MQAIEIIVNVFMLDTRFRKSAINVGETKFWLKWLKPIERVL